jgi:hypothetical protein
MSQQNPHIPHYTSTEPTTEIHTFFYINPQNTKKETHTFGKKNPHNSPNETHIFGNKNTYNEAEETYTFGNKNPHNVYAEEELLRRLIIILAQIQGLFLN